MVFQLERSFVQPIESGAVLDGRYRIVRRLAVGGMAEIYQARAVGLEGFEKPVVIKRILPQLLGTPELVGMFLDEARLAATLHHPNIAQVYDIGRDGDRYYFAMEHIAGRDVAQIRARATALGRSVPLQTAVAIATGVAAGLHAAHETRGRAGEALEIVHRDVSAANVVVSWDGGVKLIDFGIAKARRRQTHTAAGVLKGTTATMSPEQCLSRAVDRRSDIFSLGVLLWELTTGAELFAADSEFETMRRIVEGEVERPSSVVDDYPAELEAIVMRALAHRPDDRYQTAQDMLIDLCEFAREQRLNTAPYALANVLAELFPERDDGDSSDGASPPLFLATGEMPALRRAETIPDRPVDRSRRARFDRAPTSSVALGSDPFLPTGEVDLAAAGLWPPTSEYGSLAVGSSDALAVDVAFDLDAVDIAFDLDAVVAIDLAAGAAARGDDDELPDPTSILRIQRPSSAPPSPRRRRVGPVVVAGAALVLAAAAAVLLGINAQRGRLTKTVVVSPPASIEPVVREPVTPASSEPIVTKLAAEPPPPDESADSASESALSTPAARGADPTRRPQILRRPAPREPTAAGVSWVRE